MWHKIIFYILKVLTDFQLFQSKLTDYLVINIKELSITLAGHHGYPFNLAKTRSPTSYELLIFEFLILVIFNFILIFK